MACFFVLEKAFHSSAEKDSISSSQTAFMFEFPEASNLAIKVSITSDY